MTYNYQNNQNVKNNNTYVYKDTNWAGWIWGVVIFLSFILFMIYKGAQSDSFKGATSYQSTPRYEEVKEYEFQTPTLQSRGIIDDYWKLESEYRRQLTSDK